MGDEPSADQLMPGRPAQGGGLYIHWPGGLAPERRLVEALAAAFERQAEAAPPQAEAALPMILRTVLIGGTAPPPSPSSLAQLLARLPLRGGVDGAREITLEVDPGATALDQLSPLRRAGIGRLVLSAGALDEHASRLASAAALIFARVGLDLSFARPGQSAGAFAAELSRAVALGVGHLSLAEFEPGADDHQRAGTERAEVGADHYLLAIRQLTATGLAPYDVAHLARSGQESRHHLHVATGGPFIGIGPGAVGRQRRAGAWWALESIVQPEAWLGAVEAGGAGLAERRPLAPRERASELLITGLRLRAGVARRWFEPLAAHPIEAALPAAGLAELIGDGFLELDAVGLRLTERGWPLADAVLRRLLG